MTEPAATRSATIVGGGPAGLMAAEVLAHDGVAVTVHEHMPSVGRKLLLAGRGGLNITHSESLDEMLARYGDAAARIGPAIRTFGPSDLRSWCADLGETTFVGSSGRVFPASFRATPLLHRVARSSRAPWGGARGSKSMARLGDDARWRHRCTAAALLAIGWRHQRIDE